MYDKKFLPASRIGTLLRSITAETGTNGRIKRVYNGGGDRVNDNDGIVFTPAAKNYRDLMNRRAGLLKWKFQEENTVDFRIKANELEQAVATDGSRLL